MEEAEGGLYGADYGDEDDCYESAVMKEEEESLPRSMMAKRKSSPKMAMLSKSSNLFAMDIDQLQTIRQE